jgi:ribonuclease HII
MTRLAKGATIRRDAGLYGFERALERQGLHPVAGVDEAGRGACAGPLVAAAVVLDRSIKGLADSKLLSEAQREVCFDLIMKRAVDVSVVIIPAGECDRMGLHRANIAALRRALARLTVRPGYILTDGFPVDGLGVPGLAVWKGDRVAASIAAASVIAKVTRDRMMVRMHEDFPAYDFATHKGYCTSAHQDALQEHGPCAEHRMTYVNVRAVMENRTMRQEVSHEL